jgi:hypothetical protein
MTAHHSRIFSPLHAKRQFARGHRLMSFMSIKNKTPEKQVFFIGLRK